MIKKTCVAVAMCGFILAYGTAGASDLEMEIRQTLITDVQFYIHMFLGVLMLVFGSIGTRICNSSQHHYICNTKANKGYKRLIDADKIN